MGTIAITFRVPIIDESCAAGLDHVCRVDDGKLCNHGVKLPPGQRWRNKEENRIAVILEKEVHGTGPAWRWEDALETAWHYSDAADWYIWSRWEFVTDFDEVPDVSGDERYWSSKNRDQLKTAGLLEID